MTHLDELRLMELGLDSAGVPREAEATHLRDCEACRTALAHERALTGALERLPQSEVPAGFVLRTRYRFTTARTASRRRVVVWSMLAATVLTGVALASLAIGVDWELPRIITGVGWMIARVAMLGRVAVVLLRTVPLLAMMLAAAVGTSVLIWTAMLTELARARAPGR
ncbi:MAG: hypothetical protein AAB426_10785 [Myxococcota bacterium]